MSIMNHAVAAQTCDGPAGGVQGDRGCAQMHGHERCGTNAGELPGYCFKPVLLKVDLATSSDARPWPLISQKRGFANALPRGPPYKCWAPPSTGIREQGGPLIEEGPLDCSPPWRLRQRCEMWDLVITKGLYLSYVLVRFIRCHHV